MNTADPGYSPNGSANLRLNSPAVWPPRLKPHTECADYGVDFVPHPHEGEKGCVIEAFNAVGESIAVVAVPLSAIEPLAADEVLAIRRLANPRESA